MRPRLIGIAGPSCSGKTTLARCLADALPGRSTLLSLDSYYRDFANLPSREKARFNFDAPEALDLDLLAQNLEALARGEAVEKPVYLFPTHSRAPQGERVKPGDHVIVEGLFALYWERSRRLYQVCIFVEAGDQLCLERRLERDTTERGRTHQSILEQYEKQVRPMSARHVRPTTRFADLVLRGDAPLEDALKVALERIQAEYSSPTGF